MQKIDDCRRLDDLLIGRVRSRNEKTSRLSLKAEGDVKEEDIGRVLQGILFCYHHNRTLLKLSLLIEVLGPTKRVHQ